MRDATGSDLGNLGQPFVADGETASRWKTDAIRFAVQAVPQMVTGVSVSGDVYAPTLMTAGTRATGVAIDIPLAVGKAQQRSPMVPPKTKHARYAVLTACIDNLDRAIDHSEQFFLRNNALEQLKESLSGLWDTRTEAEEPFAELINMLQGVFAQRTVEDFTNTQVECLRSVFDKLREKTDYDNDFANGITLELLEGGVDAFREIE